jgi:hypothetical protein
MPSSFWTAERLTLYPRALVVALVLAVGFGALSADGARLPTGGRLGGDYAAFHAVGRIVLAGDVAHLYEEGAQAAAQADLHPGEPHAYLAFAYPPFVAAAAAPLAAIPFPAAWAVHTAFMAACLAVALRLLRPRWPAALDHPSAQFAAALTFYPMFRSVLGGQNTALSALCLAMAWRAVGEGRPAAAGAAAALLCFKPQFGLPLLALLTLWRPSVWRGAAPVLMALWAAGAAVAGPGWVTWWWGSIGAFYLRDRVVDAPNSVGLLGSLEALIGPGDPRALALGAIATLAVASVAAFVWWRQRGSLDARMALTAVTLVLVPPHSLYYDAGLAAFAGLWWTASGRGRRAAAFWALGFLSMASTSVHPLGPLLLVAWGLLATEQGGEPLGAEGAHAHDRGTAEVQGVDDHGGRPGAGG